jgi:uncharacterized protein with ParB-like and HNH nuclease domain
MEAHSMYFSQIISPEVGAKAHYHVPKFQREYTWGRVQLEKLLQDVDENDQGYFMGSIICVKDGDTGLPTDEVIYEVIDGQQRLVTLSLLMMAIYKHLQELKPKATFDDEQERADFLDTVGSLRNKLLKRKKDFRKGESGGFIDSKWMYFCRVQPSFQNHNLDDYHYLLGDLGLIKQPPKARYFGNRAISKAFRYFQENIPQDVKSLLELVAKINNLNFVYISVGSEADAFTLFETLNNRGIALSAIDIIKNKIMSEMEKEHKIHVDETFEKWQEIITALPDAGDQERFLRHFYNAFKTDKNIRVDGIPRAIKSKIIAIYEALIKKDVNYIFGELRQKAPIYGEFMNPDLDSPLAASLLDLSQIGAAPSYQILLYLFSQDKQSFQEKDFLKKTIDLLCQYYVRRNVTDKPSTRDLDPAHIDLIEKCDAKIREGKRITLDFFTRELLKGKAEPASLNDFRSALENGIYSNNVNMARYLFIKLDNIYHSREYRPDLWARDDRGRFVWTVEHIFPQADHISKEWIDMIGGGDKKMAEEIQGKHLHDLGNLTLSGYNSKLSAAPFQKKQELHKDTSVLGYKINIGYCNGLALNNLEFEVNGRKITLANAKEWKKEMIVTRTQVMADILVKLYRFPGEK